jgi:hypothetical protein
MSLSHSPSIVTSGLVLCLDAANPRSYPGSGTTIYDISGSGYNGTLVNGPTFSSVNGGVIVTDGVNDYIDVPGINLATSTYTVFGAARYVTVSGRMITAKVNNWLMGHWSGTTENYYAEGWVSTAGSGAADTNWRIYSASWNQSTDSAALYTNGALTSGPNTSASAGPNGICIGAHNAISEWSNGQFSFVMVYNKVLTADEVTQNFNALRGRFGI